MTNGWRSSLKSTEQPYTPPAWAKYKQPYWSSPAQREATEYWRSPAEKLYGKQEIQKTEYTFDRATATFTDQTGKELGKLLYNKAGNVVGYEDYSKQTSVQFKQPLSQKDALNELAKTQEREMIAKAIAQTQKGYITTAISPYTPPALREAEVGRQLLGLPKSPYQKALESEAERRGMAYTSAGLPISVEPSKAGVYLTEQPTTAFLKEQAEMERRFLVEKGKEAPFIIKATIPKFLSLAWEQRGKGIPLSETFYESAGKLWTKQQESAMLPDVYVRQPSYLAGREGTLVGVDTQLTRATKSVMEETVLGGLAVGGMFGSALSIASPLIAGLGAGLPKVSIPILTKIGKAGEFITIPLKTVPITTVAEAGIGTAMLVPPIISIVKAPTSTQRVAEIESLGIGMAGVLAGVGLARALAPKPLPKAIETITPEVKPIKDIFSTKGTIGELRQILAEARPYGKTRISIVEKPLTFETLTFKQYPTSIPTESLKYADVGLSEFPFKAKFKSIGEYEFVKPPTLFEQRFGKLGLAPQIIEVTGLGKGRPQFKLGYGKPIVEFVEASKFWKELTPREYTKYKEPTAPTVARTEVELYTKVAKAGKEPSMTLTFKAPREMKPLTPTPQGQLYAELGIREAIAKPRPMKAYEITEPYVDVRKIIEAGDQAMMMKARVGGGYGATEVIQYPPSSKFGFEPQIISSEPAMATHRGIQLGITPKPETTPFIITAPKVTTALAVTPKTTQALRQLQRQKLELIQERPSLQAELPAQLQIITPITAITPMQVTVQALKQKITPIEKITTKPRPTEPTIQKPRPPPPILKGLPPFAFLGEKKKKKVKGKKLTAFEKGLMAKVDVFPLPDPISILQTEIRTGKRAKFLLPTPKVKKAFEKAVAKRPFLWRFPTAEMFKRGENILLQ